MIATSTQHKKEVKQRFLAMFHAFEATLNGMRTHPLHEIRKMAIARFQEVPFPTLKTEEWKYTSVGPIVQQDYVKVHGDSELMTLPVPLNKAFVVQYHNGSISISNRRELKESIHISSISEALEHPMYSSTVKTTLTDRIRKAEHPFELLGIALCGDGLFVHVPAKTTILEPIFIQNISTAPHGLNSLCQVINLAESSELTLIEMHRGHAGSYLTCSTTGVTLAQNAILKHFKVQEEDNASFHISDVKVEQDRNSTYTGVNLDLGGRIVRNNLQTIHKNSGVHTDFIGGYLTSGRQHIDNYTLIDHAVPHCTSNELYKGILTGKSKGVFNGRVIVRQDAQKTNAFQQNSSLVLSEDAMMYAKPQLEIFADDVRCSHGATIGQLDEEAVYYLRSRGLSDSESRSMLQFAFLAEVLDHLSIEELRNYCMEAIRNKMNNG